MKSIKELEKGCEKRFNSEMYGYNTNTCGDISFKNKILYCPECKAKLQQSEEFLGLMKSIHLDFFSEEREVKNFINIVKKEVEGK